VQVQPGEQPGNSPEVQPQGTGDEAAPDQWRVIVTEGRRGYEGHILLLDQTSDLPEQYIADVKGRTPEKVRETAEWLIGEEQRDHGGGQPHQIEWIDQAGDPDPRLLKADPDPTDTDLPAGTSPAGTPSTPSTTAIPTQGDPVPSYTTTANVPSVELNDLDSLKRFAEYISSLGEDSEFMQIVERCKSLRESLREGGFGGHVDQAGASFEETAAALGQLGTEFCEEAGQMAQLAANVAGG
jgi:hypothetical protein